MIMQVSVLPVIRSVCSFANTDTAPVSAWFEYSHLYFITWIDQKCENKGSGSIVGLRMSANIFFVNS